MATAQRRLSVIVAADVVGYSRLMGEDEEGTLTALKGHREAIDAVFVGDGGRIVKTTGDGILLEFPSAFHAVRAALGVQQLMAERNADVPPERRLIFRMGVHLGDVIVDDDDIFGDGVNIAARLQEIAEPGGICLSQPVHGTIHKNIDALFRDGGNKMLKNIAAPVHIFNLALDGAPPEPPKPAIPVAPPLISAMVLPFANLSGDARQEYFVDSVTDRLTSELAKIDSSFVIPRATALAYRGETLEVTQIGRELGVRFVVKGSVRVADGHFRVNAQLIDAEDGRPLWVDRFDLTVGDPFSMQHDIVARMMPPLRAQLLAATGRGPQPPAAEPARRALPQTNARPARSPAMVVHPRSAPPAVERRAVTPAPVPQRPRPAPLAASAPTPAAPIAALPPIRSLPAQVVPAAHGSPTHRPWLWSVCLGVAAIALLVAVVLAILGIQRSLVVETASWVLLVAGAVQLASALVGGRRA